MALPTTVFVLAKKTKFIQASDHK